MKERTLAIEAAAQRSTFPCRKSTVGAPVINNYSGSVVASLTSPAGTITNMVFFVATFQVLTVADTNILCHPVFVQVNHHFGF
jgi:hypothetical protein